MRAFLAAAGASVLLLTLGGGTASAEGCLYQDEVANGSNQPRVERSLLCLANAVRGRAGLASLVADPRLNAAARAHSADMVARGQEIQAFIKDLLREQALIAKDGRAL